MVPSRSQACDPNLERGFAVDGTRHHLITFCS